MSPPCAALGSEAVLRLSLGNQPDMDIEPLGRILWLPCREVSLGKKLSAQTLGRLGNILALQFLEQGKRFCQIGAMVVGECYLAFCLGDPDVLSIAGPRSNEVLLVALGSEGETFAVVKRFSRREEVLLVFGADLPDRTLGSGAAVLENRLVELAALDEREGADHRVETLEVLEIAEDVDDVHAHPAVRLLLQMLEQDADHLGILEGAQSGHAHGADIVL